MPQQEKQKPDRKSSQPKQEARGKGARAKPEEGQEASSDKKAGRKGGKQRSQPQQPS